MKRWIAWTCTLVTAAACVLPTQASAFADYFFGNGTLAGGAVYQSPYYRSYFTDLWTQAYPGYSGLSGVYIANSGGGRISPYQYCDVAACRSELIYPPNTSNGGFGVAKNHGGYSSHYNGYEEY